MLLQHSTYLSIQFAGYLISLLFVDLDVIVQASAHLPITSNSSGVTLGAKVVAAALRHEFIA